MTSSTPRVHYAEQGKEGLQETGRRDGEAKESSQFRAQGWGCPTGAGRALRAERLLHPQAGQRVALGLFSPSWQDNPGRWAQKTELRQAADDVRGTQL